MEQQSELSCLGQYIFLLKVGQRRKRFIKIMLDTADLFDTVVAAIGALFHMGWNLLHRFATFLYRVGHTCYNGTCQLLLGLFRADMLVRPVLVYIMACRFGIHRVWYVPIVFRCGIDWVSQIRSQTGIFLFDYKQTHVRHTDLLPSTQPPQST